MARLGSQLARQRAPMLALLVVSVLSLGARVALLGEPCRAPCRTAGDHLLIFDEDYYVNAARVIAGIRPPAGAPYADAPLGDDPNAEHPQLAKLVMAGSIELFGDGPFAWRLGSLVMGSIAILGMFALVLAAGGSPWAAVGAAALMAADTLLMIHARIATLDIYVVAAMIWGAVAYLRGRPLLAGVAIGVGACFKEVAPYLLPCLLIWELLSWARLRDGVGFRLLRLLECTGATAGVLIGLLAVLDAIAPPYADATHQLVTGGALHHLAHIISYAEHQTSPHGPKGIASYPWQWLIDSGWITYLRIVPGSPAPGLTHITPAVDFLGVINPPILLAALIGLALAGFGGVRWIIRRGGAERTGISPGGGIPVVAVSWFLGTYMPFVVTSLIWQRTSYLYYMVIVMPGMYLAAVHLFDRLRWRWMVILWWIAVAAGAAVLYPFNPLLS